MKCQNCGENEANVKYTQIINGDKKEMFVCEKCAKNLGISDENFSIPIDFSSFFGDFIEEFEDNNFIPLIGENKELKCKECNTTYNEFLNTGKFGCANCYTTFKDKIDGILKRIQGSNKYIGKQITNTSENHIKNIKIQNAKKEEDKISKLKKDLKQAIKEERYEDAAKIRDEIKKEEE